MTGLQINPEQLHFRAAVGADSPVTLTLFNPHPVERVAFKIKTNASSTYRVWPNSGSLEAGETARVQVLLLGTKVDLADPQRVDECRRDRFQVQYMPLAEGQAFDGSLFKLFAGLVRDIKMGVDVEIVDSAAANGTQAGEETSPWEGMVRIALMRMMADEEREHAHNAACLTKFAELLVLNNIMTTEQMWAAFNLVGDMYHAPGEGQKVMSKVEQWLEHPDFLNVGDPDAASERQPSSSEGGSQQFGESNPALHTPHDREEALPTSRRDDEQNRSGEESYPNSPFTGQSGSPSPAVQDAPANGDQQRYAFAPEADGEPAAAAAEAAEAAETPQLSRQPTLTAPGSAQGFGSAHSSVARGLSVSDAEDVSLGASEDRGDLQEVSKLAANPAAVAGTQAAAVNRQAAGISGADEAAAAGRADADGQGPGSSSEDSLAAEVAKAKALAAAGAANGTAAPAGITKRVSATFAAAREAALAAEAAAEQQQRTSSKMVTPVRVSVRERKARLAERGVEPDAELQAALAEDLDDLDEAFAPGMLAEARAQMAAANAATAASAVVPPTGPHMLSFADRAALYGVGNGASGQRGGGSGPPTMQTRQRSGSISGGESGYARRSVRLGQRHGGAAEASTPMAHAAAAAAGGGLSQHQRRMDSERRALRQAAAAGTFGRDSARDSQFAQDSSREREAGLSRDSARDQGYARDSGRDSEPYQRDSGYARDSGLRQSSGYATPAGNYARNSAPYSNSPAAAAGYAAEAAAAYIRENGGYDRGPSSGANRPNGPDSRRSFESPRRGDPGAALDGPRDIGVPATSAGGGNVPFVSGQRLRSSRRSSAEGELRKRHSADEAAAAANAVAAAGGRSRMRPGASGELSSLSHPSGQTSGPSASPRGVQVLQEGPGAAAISGSPAHSTPLTDGGSESLGPAVRVLLPGKQSLTRGELAAATHVLQGTAEPGPRANSVTAPRPASARRSTSAGGGGAPPGLGQVAPDSEAPSTPADTPRSPVQTPRPDEFERSGGSPAPAAAATPPAGVGSRVSEGAATPTAADVAAADMGRGQGTVAAKGRSMRSQSTLAGKGDSDITSADKGRHMRSQSSPAIGKPPSKRSMRSGSGRTQSSSAKGAPNREDSANMGSAQLLEPVSPKEAAARRAAVAAARAAVAAALDDLPPKGGTASKRSPSGQAPPRKKGGFFKRLGEAVSTRAEAAARNAAGGSGYYYV